MKHYPTYKDSGVDWIGDIPEHWKAIKTKYLFKLITNQAPLGNKLELLSIYTNIGVKPRKDLEQKGNRASTTDSYWIVNKEDFIVNKLLAWMGAIGISEYNGVTSPAYDIIRLRSTTSNPYYYNYLLRSKLIQPELKRFSRGIMEMRLRLYFDQFGRIYLPVPPPSEQATIAKFLDYKVQQIDRFIRKKKRMIALLKEQKQAIINQAVTKGIDPNVPMKNSGIEWLGDIPEHWEKLKLKRISNKITDGEHISPEFTTQGIPFLSAKDVLEYGVDINVNKFVSVQDSLKFRSRCDPKKGDILLVSRGATIGRCSIVDTSKEFCLLGSVILIKPNRKINSQYLYYSLSNKLLKAHLFGTSSASAQQAIYLVNVAEIHIALPQLVEQQQIVSFIDKKCNSLNSTIKRVGEEISLIQEYKYALISEAVTGKIDVRNYSVPDHFSEELDAEAEENEDTELEEDNLIESIE